jgi:hypothetical protein
MKVNQRVMIVAGPSRLDQLGIGRGFDLTGKLGTAKAVCGRNVYVVEDDSASLGWGFWYDLNDIIIL